MSNPSRNAISSPVTRCPRCPHVHSRHPVPPSGPIPARLLFLGECPSYYEDKNDLIFCGKTGQELNNTYLPILGLPRSDIHVCNAVLCSRLDYSNPEPADADSCMGIHLGPLLERVRPTIIVPMGAVACSLWPEIDLNLMHGLPMEGRWGAWRGVLWPSYHPSAGIHQSSFMIPLQMDFHNLKEFLRRLDAQNN